MHLSGFAHAFVRGASKHSGLAVSMPVCIHCGTPVPSLYLRYGKDHIVPSPCRSSICAPAAQGGEVVLADEYLEHGITIVILDLILAKPRAYRHLLFNRSHQEALSVEGRSHRKENGERADLVRKCLALGLIDAYIRWFYLCVEPALPDSGEVLAGADSSSSLSRFVAGLPLQAGLFFPSYTPASHINAAAAVHASPLCSTTWLWLPDMFITSSSQHTDQILPTLLSYLNIAFVTLVESAALHLAVCLTTWFVAATQRPDRQGTPVAKRRQSIEHSFWQPSRALALSQLSPLILLSFVLLWSSKFPHSASSTSNVARSATTSMQSRSVIWVIRTLLSSLNAGIAIATLIPLQSVSSQSQPLRSRVWLTPFILAMGWLAQGLASFCLYKMSENLAV